MKDDAIYPMTKVVKHLCYAAGIIEPHDDEGPWARENFPGPKWIGVHLKCAFADHDAFEKAETSIAKQPYFIDVLIGHAPTQVMLVSYRGVICKLIIVTLFSFVQAGYVFLVRGQLTIALAGETLVSPVHDVVANAAMRGAVHGLSELLNKGG